MLLRSLPSTREKCNMGDLIRFICLIVGVVLFLIGWAQTPDQVVLMIIGAILAVIGGLWLLAEDVF
jgi:hypothetical protein